jgi:hypothetical protein
MADMFSSDSHMYELPILDALNDPGCVLCRVEYASGQSYLQTYASSAHWNLCVLHAGRAVNMMRKRSRNLRDFTSLGESITQGAADSLRALLDAPGQPNPLASSERCPACACATESSLATMIRIPALMGRPLFKDWRAAGGRLCLRHLRTCARAGKRFKALSRFLAEELQSLESLCAELRRSWHQTISGTSEHNSVEQHALAQLAMFLAGGDIEAEQST